MTDATDDGVSLRHDVTAALIECHRENRLAQFLQDGATLAQLGEVLARKLAPMIGGRYIPKWDERPARDAAVCHAFTGRNHAEVMRQFGISRRLLYSILARKRKAT